MLERERDVAASFKVLNLPEHNTNMIMYFPQCLQQVPADSICLPCAAHQAVCSAVRHADHVCDALH